MNGKLRRSVIVFVLESYNVKVAVYFHVPSVKSGCNIANDGF